MNSALTLKSSNSKTGPITVSTSSRKSCAPGCPLAGENGCYAEAGYYTRMHWDAVTQGARGVTPLDFIQKVAKLKSGSMFRHNVAGDLWPTSNREQIDRALLMMLAAASNHLIAWTYTHHKKTLANLAAIRSAIRRGFTINLSTESKSEAARFFKRGYPVTCVVPNDAPRKFTVNGVTFRQCPATLDGSTVTCATCGGANGKPLCSIADRPFVIAFPVHGSRSATAATQCS